MRKRSLRALSLAAGSVAVVAGLGSAGVNGAIQTWDANGAAPINDGNGNWNLTNVRWTSNGTTFTAWNNLANDEAFFGASAGNFTVSVGDAAIPNVSVVASGIRINQSYSLVPLNGGGITLSTASPTLNSANDGALISAPISAANKVIFGNINTSTLALSGNNTFTSGIDVVGGTLRFDGKQAVNGAALSITGASTLLFSSTPTVLTDTYSSNITVTGTSHNLNTSGARKSYLTGAISGSGRVNVSATQGATVLAGSNSYEGATSISGQGGAIFLAHSSALGNSVSIGATGSTASTIGIEGNITISAANASNAPRLITLANAQPANGMGHLYNYSGSNTINANMTLSSNTARVISAEPGTTLTLNGVLGGGAGSKGVLKLGGGTLVFTNANTYGAANAGTGNETEVREGVLLLDFSQSAVSIDLVNNGNATNGNGASGLNMAGGKLQIKGKNAATNSQRWNNTITTPDNGFTIKSGASTIEAIKNGATALSSSFGQINTRYVGGTLNLILPTGTQSATNGFTAGNTINLNGIVGGFMTVGGTDWASTGASGTNPIVPLATYTNNTWTAGQNTTVTTSNSVAAGTNTNSLRFHSTAASTVTLGGTSVITSGGILNTSTVGNNISRITGGTLVGSVNPSVSSTYRSGNYSSDLIIHQNNVTTLTDPTPSDNNSTHALVIDSVIANPAGTTKTADVPAGSNQTATLPSGNTRNLYIGMPVTGSGISAGATVSRILTDTSFTISGTTSLLSSATLTFGGISGLTKSGAGNLVLTNANTYSGVTTAAEGVLVFDQAAALPGGMDHATASTESGLQFKGGVVGLKSNFSRALSIGGTIGITLPEAGLVRWNSSGGFAAYGADRTVGIATSNTNPSLATLDWGGTGGSGTSSGFVPSMSSLLFGAVDATHTLIFQNNVSLSNSNILAWQTEREIDVRNGLAVVDARMTGVISGEIGLRKTGTGTLELTNNQTYDGVTIVRAGKLLVNGSLDLGFGQTTVESGATLGGNGAVGPLSVLAGGILAPGNSPGSLQANSLSLSGGSTFAVEITGDDFALNSTEEYDRVKVTAAGAVSLGNATLSVDLGSYLLESDDLFGIIQNDSTSAIAGEFLGLAQDAIVAINNGYELHITYTGAVTDNTVSKTGGNDVVLYTVAVPEPAMLSFGLTGASLLTRRRRQL